MTEETKCDCQHCGGHIAFVPAQSVQKANCPHCGEETLLTNLSIPSPQFFIWQNEQQQGPFEHPAILQMLSQGQISGDTLLCSEDGGSGWTPAKQLLLQDSPPESLAVTTIEAVEQGRSGSPTEEHDNGWRLEIKLDSGAELKIKAVRLYDEINLAEISSLRSEAVKKLQGISTGLGSIGSLEWVLASSVVIGAVEGVLSAGAASSGMNQLSEVIKLEQALRQNGVFLPVGKIENIEAPLPGIWRVFYKRQGKVEAGKTFLGEKKYELREVQSAYIHSGDDFLTVQTDDGAVRSIRWSAVGIYVCQKPKEQA